MGEKVPSSVWVGTIQLVAHTARTKQAEVGISSLLILSLSFSFCARCLTPLLLSLNIRLQVLWPLNSVTCTSSLPKALGHLASDCGLRCELPWFWSFQTWTEPCHWLFSFPSFQTAHYGTLPFIMSAILPNQLCFIHIYLIGSLPLQNPE